MRMIKELQQIFLKTIDHHYDVRFPLSKEEYGMKFNKILKEERKYMPKFDTNKGNLATYLKLSILALCMIRLLETCNLSEDRIGEILYNIANAYFYVPPIKRFFQRMLFFTKINKYQIKKRELLSNQKKDGINGFKIKLLESDSKDSFTVEYQKC